MVEKERGGDVGTPRVIKIYLFNHYPSEVIARVAAFDLQQAYKEHSKLIKSVPFVFPEGDWMYMGSER